MSELALVFSDLHVHQYKAFNEGGRRLKNGIDFLDYIFELAYKNGIKYILMPGDLTNNMSIINTKVVNALVKCFKENFEKYPNITFIAIPGNHDDTEQHLIDSPAESALNHLQTIFEPQFFLLGQVTGYNYNILGIPYHTYPEHFREALKKKAEEVIPGKVTILLTHQTIASGLPVEDDIDFNDPLFDPFDLVLNGHIHLGQQVTDKFINVGSPMHRDAGDVGKRKGFWIVDLDDPVNTISFKDITDKYPQFIYKTIGEELTDWEKQQYVIFQPPILPEESVDRARSEKFQNSLTPKELLKNYCEEVLPVKEIDEKLKYGVSLL